jgi:drug/metabolite transporter (DMT)-like permease
MPFSENLLKFLVLCLVWGLTWIATKVGIGAVPPLLFAATRFIAAGMIVSLWVWREIHFSEWQKNDVIRLFAASLLMVTLTYGPLFWGMRYVSSGTAGVLEMSLTPIALLGFGIALGQERWSWVNAIAMALGIAGLCVLFAPSVKANEGAGGLVHCRLRGHRLGGGILRLGLCARAAGDRALRQRYALGRDHADRRGRPASGLARLGAKLCSIFRGVLGGACDPGLALPPPLRFACRLQPLHAALT